MSKVCWLLSLPPQAALSPATWHQFEVRQWSHKGEKLSHCDICGKAAIWRISYVTTTAPTPTRDDTTAHCAPPASRGTTARCHFSCCDYGRCFCIAASLKPHLNTTPTLKQVQQKHANASDLGIPTISLNPLAKHCQFYLTIHSGLVSNLQLCLGFSLHSIDM